MKRKSHYQAILGNEADRRPGRLPGLIKKIHKELLDDASTESFSTMGFLERLDEADDIWRSIAASAGKPLKPSAFANHVAVHEPEIYDKWVAWKKERQGCTSGNLAREGGPQI